MSLQVGILAQGLRRIKVHGQTHLVVAGVYTRVTQATDKNPQVECRSVAAFFKPATAMHLARDKMMKRERHLAPAEWAGAGALAPPTLLYERAVTCSVAICFHCPMRRFGCKLPGCSTERGSRYERQQV